MMESSYYRSIMEEGEVRGLRRTLVNLGEKQFGPIPSHIRTVIQDADLETLHAAVGRLLTATSWDEPLAPAPPAS